MLKLDALISSLKNTFKYKQLSEDERNYLTGNMLRLKAIKTAVHELENKSDGTDSASFLQALPGSVSERRSIGHWCTHSAAAAREERFKRIERSYEQDFGHAMNLDLDSLISSVAAHKALNTYMDNAAAIRGNEVSSPHRTEDLQSLLFRMAVDGDIQVRISVAGNPNAPTSAMWKLSKDSCPDVRFALLANHSLPASIIKAMTFDDDLRIKRKAISLLTGDASRLQCEPDLQAAV